jgi:hypothetical protein
VEVWGKPVEVELTPETILIFECKNCLKLFDIRTNSFRKLCAAARNAEWKIEWLMTGTGAYHTYCEECKND